MGLRDIPVLLQETALAWYADRGPRLVAALAFYTLFSLAPLLIIVIAVAAVAFGRELAQTQLVQQIEAVVGAEGLRVIQSTIDKTSRPNSGIIATLAGLTTLLFGATVVFSELQDALNTIWKAPPNPRHQTTSEHCLPPWGMKPTVLDHRNLADLHALTLTH